MFIHEARTFGNTFPRGSCPRAFFDIICENAVGQQNAMSKQHIASLLRERGFNRSKKFLAANYIAPSRNLPHFFGIKRYGGIYIIDNQTDARITLEYYRDQIRGIQRHVRYLRQLCGAYGWRVWSTHLLISLTDFLFLFYAPTLHIAEWAFFFA